MEQIAGKMNDIKKPVAVVPGEKRRVAVLAMQIKGFQNPLEDSNERLLALILSELSSCIATFGGVTSRISQDRIQALFGAEHATEQACQRAIDCSIRILGNLEMINKSIGTDQGMPPVSVSAGIAWGPSTILTESGRQTEVHGESVDIAQHLLKKSPEGSILVSNSAKVFCENSFSWEKFSDDDDSWIASSGKGSFSIQSFPHKVPLIGMDREMEHINAAYSSYLKWFNHPGVVIVGKPGSGKTRLIEQFLSTVSKEETDIILLKNTLWDQPPLGTWLPLMKKGTFDPYGTVMTEIRRLRSEKNLILIIEDLHWADMASLKLLDQLCNAVSEAGVFLIITSRKNPEGNLLKSTELLALQGLNEHSIELLLFTILGTAEGSESKIFSDFLLEKTGGNPLLLTELIFHAAERNIIGRNRKNSWFINRKLDQVLSENAESFLQSRLANLAQDDKFILQVAAVLGNGFKEDLLHEICFRLGKRSSRITLSHLLKMGFLHSSKEGTLGFVNSLLAETIYDTILKENKITIHRMASLVLTEDLDPSDRSTGAITLSRHLIESESADNAIPWLFSALEQCIDAADINRAEIMANELHKRIPENSLHSNKLAYFDMTLYSLMGKFQLVLNTAEQIKHSFSGGLLAKIYSSLAQAKENLGMPLKEVLKEYMLAVEQAEASGDKNTIANCLGAAGAVNVSLGRKNEALADLNRALVYEDSLDTKSLAKLHGNMGILMQRTGSLVDALAHYKKTYELGKKCGEASIEANGLAYMGHVEINMGKKEEGIRKYREALAIHRKSGNARGECIILGNLGGTLARFGEAENAIEALERAIRIAEEIGHTRGVMTFHANIGLAYKLAGKYRKAEKHIRQSMQMISKTGDKRALAVCHLNLAGVLASMWNVQEAIDEARRSLRFACVVNALTTQSRALCTLGWLMLKTDRARMALNFFKESYKRCSMAQDHSSLSGPVIGESRALNELGNTSGAEKKYKEAIELIAEFGMDVEGEKDLIELKDLLGISNE